MQPDYIPEMPSMSDPEFSSKIDDYFDALDEYWQQHSRDLEKDWWTETYDWHYQDEPITQRGH